MSIDHLDGFIKRTKNKYPLLAKKGYCWVRNFPKGADLWKPHYALNKMWQAWHDKEDISIVGLKKCPNLPAYFLNGTLDENSYPVFFEMGDREILDKLGYALPDKVVWAGRGMTKTKEKVSRFDLIDLEDD
jgi:hypothetical protein